MDLGPEDLDLFQTLEREAQQSPFERLPPEAYAKMLLLAKRDKQFAADLAVKAAVLRRARCVIARRDASGFCEYVLRNESDGRQIRQAPMHESMHRIIRRWSRAVIWGSPASGKSLQFAVGLPLFEIGNDANIHICVIQATDTLAKKTVSSLASYIADPMSPGYEPLHEVFPHLKPSTAPNAKWNAHALTVERSATARDPTVQCCGLFGNILGARLDLVIIDDILTFNNTRNPETRQKVLDWIVTTVLNRLDPEKGRIVFLGNAWHPDDAMHVLAEGRLDEAGVEHLGDGVKVSASGWVSARFPLRDEHGKTTWPDKWPQHVLDRAIKGLPPAEVARTFDCVAQSDATSRFKLEWFRKSKVKGLAGEIAPGEVALMRTSRPDDDPRAYYVGVDLAFADIDKRGDRTAIGVIAVDSNGKVELVSVRSGRFTLDEVIGEIVSAYHLWDPAFIFVESNAAQRVIGRLLKGGLEGLGLYFPPSLKSRIRDYETTVSKHHPKWGIEGIGVEMANGLWSIPCGAENEVHSEIERWINEMISYSPDRKVHTGDRAMAVYMAWDGCRRRLGNRMPAPLDEAEAEVIAPKGVRVAPHRAAPAPPKKEKKPIAQALAEAALTQPAMSDPWADLDDFIGSF